MSWFRVNDQAAFHPKIMGAGNAAAGAWMRMGSWAGAQLTNGFIPLTVALAIATAEEIERLVRAGLLDRVEGGYQLHDYLQFNPSREQVLAERKAKREGGQRGASKRWGAPNGGSHGVSDASFGGITNGSSHEGSHAPLIGSGDAPVPVPVPAPVPIPSQITKTTTAAAPLGDAGSPAIAVREIFDHWAKKQSALTKAPIARLKLTRERRGKILGRLAEGYSIGDLKRAIDGLFCTPFNIEKHFTDVELACRDAVHVDRFMGSGATKPIGIHRDLTAELARERAEFLARIASERESTPSAVDGDQRGQS